MRARAFKGQLDLNTGKGTVAFEDISGFSLKGNVGSDQASDIMKAVRSCSGDSAALRDRIAERADQNADSAVPTTASPPSSTTASREYTAPTSFTDSGRYAEAKGADEVGLGRRGDSVRDVQQKLSDLGYELGDSAVDGFWGPKTNEAFQKYISDTGGKLAHGGALERLRGESRDKFRPVEDAARAAHELKQDIGDGQTDDINGTLTTTRNKGLKEIGSKMSRDDDGKVDFADNGSVFGVEGNNADYNDLANRILDGNRLEGDAAAADAPVTDELMRGLIASRHQPGFGALPAFMNGTDEASLNHVLSRASGAQLAEMDRRLKDGVKDDAGNTVQYDEGIAGLIDSEVGESAHRDLLRAQLNRPLR